MWITNDIKILKEGGIFIKSLNAIVISDVHLGYELYLAEKGVFIPQTQLKKLKTKFKKLSKNNSEKLIINGDLKHEFGEASKQEWREVFEFINEAKKYFKRIILVRGNHDNYLLTIISKLDLKLYDPYYMENGYLFVHGHKIIEIDESVHTIIIGHEEPTIILKKGFDKIKVKCVLKGKYKDKTLIVLPAFSTLSSGTEVNMLEKIDFLSPYLKNVDIEDFEVYGIDESVGVLFFGKLKNLKY